jgi:lipopolysaccharide exporter
MSNMAEEINVRSTLLRGAAWSLGMRWCTKLLGLASTVVLARLLSPADYGLVAMAMLMVYMVEVLVDFGADMNVLRAKTPDRDLIDSAWTLRIIQGVCVGALLMLTAPLAGRFFDEPRVVDIIWIMAICLSIASATNIGITLARKELHFDIEFKFFVASKLLTVVVMLLCAFFLRNYWALVVGLAVGNVGGFLLSYAMHPYRPRLNVSRLREIWAFSKWLLVSGIGNYINRRMDEVIVGRISDAHTLGVYGVAAELGQLPTAEIGPPLMRAILPTLSNFKDDIERVRRVVLRALGGLNTITLPAAVGLALVAPQLVLALLGEKWVEAAPILAVFAVVGAIKIGVGPLPSLLVLLGLSKLYARIMWMELGGFVVAALILVPVFGVMGLAYARIVAVIVNLVGYFFLVRTKSGITIRQISGVLWRPLIGIVILVSAVMSVPAAIGDTWIGLLLKIVLGAVAYAVWIFGSWAMSGREQGIEALALDGVRGLLARMRRKT